MTDRTELIDFEVQNPITIPYRPTLRLTKLIPRGTNPDYLELDLCWHCKENKATKNFNTNCERCWFYMKNQFNDKMYYND